MIRQSESIQALAEALSKAQGEVENASKNASNPHFKSKYADLAEIINTVRPVLAKHGLAVVQFPGYADGVVTVETVLTHKSGEWMAGVSGAPIGKADPQGVGSALTYLRRYSLAAVCAIAQEDDDGQAASRPREDKPDDRPKASDSKPATDKQVGFVEKLAKSSKLTEEEREGIHKRLLHGMTAKQASDAIEWLTATIAEREKEEEAA